MRLSISNIAWDPAEDEAVAALLNARAIDAIDIAPGKYFPDPAATTDAEIARVRGRWRARGIDIVGMQALLFGTTGLNLFGPAPVQDAMLAHLAAVCRIGAGLGATRLVFGSPRNRDRTGLSDEQAVQAALPFLGRLGDIAADCGVIVCLEPNPVCYGANFMTATPETASVVSQLGHRSIRMQFDTGALAINGEDAGTEMGRYAALIGHIHASEPDLLPLGDGATDHASAAAAIAAALPSHIVTVEMLATRVEPHVQAVARALDVALRHYRGSRASHG
ncbi:MAG TPA: sugar phosphate isomerase/epimerase [Telluria sp.]